MFAAAHWRSAKRVRPGRPASRRIQPKGTTMAKGQQRSNKEAKKPKQVKPKPPATAASTTSRITESQDRAKGPKK
jgi:hypothetical protein